MLPIALLSLPWRIVAAILVVASVVTLPTYLVATIVLPPVPPMVMIRSFLLGTALPGLVAWGVVRAFAGTATRRDGVLELRRADLAVDVPTASIATVRQWWMPLPQSGVTLRVVSDARLRLRIATGDPNALLDLVGVPPERRTPTIVWAGTRRPRRWYAAPLKFAVFGAAPAALLFYTHQHIAYGGTFGQWYLEGPGPWLATLLQYWATTVILLVSWASAWRIVGEAVVWTAALAGAGPARAARRVVEGACALAYWGGVPAFLALRYLA